MCEKQLQQMNFDVFAESIKLPMTSNKVNLNWFMPRPSLLKIELLVLTTNHDK